MTGGRATSGTMRPRCPRCGEKVRRSSDFDRVAQRAQETHDRPDSESQWRVEHTGLWRCWEQCLACGAWGPTTQTRGQIRWRAPPGDAWGNLGAPAPPRDPYVAAGVPPPPRPQPAPQPLPWWRELLGIPHGPIDPTELRAQFRKRVKLHHPDQGGDEEKMRKLNAAMEIARARLGMQR